MLSPVPPTPQPPPLGEKETPFDWDTRLSLEAIRAHTKTGDFPGVTDEQLRLYRQAAIEAAELYTGELLFGKKNMTEPVTTSPRSGQHHYKFRLKYPTVDGIVYLYGGLYQKAIRIQTSPGRRTVRLPNMTYQIDLSNCCNPCSVEGYGLMVAYQAGYDCADKVPAGIILGILQFLAWVVEHPGDELLTMRNRLDARGGAGVYGTNNIAMASGAIETWRIYDPEAI